MNHPQIHYTAYFVNNPEKLLLLFPTKHKNTYAHHSTNAYQPTSIEHVEVGKNARLKIIGRVFDDKGDALLVENSKSANEFSHITISCADGVAPKYSNELIAHAIEQQNVTIFLEPVYIEVTEGYALKSGVIVSQ